MKTFDLIFIGAGPAGSTCAALCAKKGMKVLLLDASRFPRDKVCGDCLNPAVWPILDQLGISSLVKVLPHSAPKLIRFSVEGHGISEFPISRENQEIVIRRREFDALLVNRAIELGVVFQDGTPVTNLQHKHHLWEVSTPQGMPWKAPRIVAADGRNSATARQLKMFSHPLRDERIGLQTHIPHPPGYDGSLEMHLYRHGYGGLADLGNGLANLCLVANAGALRELRKEAEERYHLGTAIVWRTITPIGRLGARHVARDGVFLCGDAARVVEPFTGEGIAFALRSAALLSNILVSKREKSPGDDEKKYRVLHRQIYQNKLFVNQFTRLLSRHPRLAHSLAPWLMKSPKALSIMLDIVLQRAT